MKEVWKFIPGYGNRYMASDKGRVKSMPKYVDRDRGSFWTKEKVMKGTFNDSGYILVSLDNKQERVHRVVAKTFIPNTESKPCINHKNGIKTDNRVDNLEWCTRKENNQHAFETNLINNHGENSAHSKLKDLDVWEIIFHVSLGEQQKDIADEFNVSSSTVCDILKKRTWKHINTNQIPR